MDKHIAYTFENLGKRDPQYGGVLTDVSTLEEGTQFYVCNGGWSGKIVMKDGEKCISIGDPDARDNAAQRIVPVHPGRNTDNILALSDIKAPEKKADGIQFLYEKNKVNVHIHGGTPSLWLDGPGTGIVFSPDTGKPVLYMSNGTPVAMLQGNKMAEQLCGLVIQLAQELHDLREQTER